MPRRFVGYFEQIISLTGNLIAELIMTVGIGREGGMGLNLIQEGMEKATPVLDFSKFDMNCKHKQKVSNKNVSA